MTNLFQAIANAELLEMVEGLKDSEVAKISGEAYKWSIRVS